MKILNSIELFPMWSRYFIDFSEISQIDKLLEHELKIESVIFDWLWEDTLDIGRYKFEFNCNG